MGKLFEFSIEFPDMLEFRKSETTTSSRIESPLETMGAKINAKAFTVHVAATPRYYHQRFSPP
jgi:hypothetical protein